MVLILRILKWLALTLAVAASVALYGHVRLLDAEVSSRFEGQRWELPAQVYARPLELYAGQRLTRAALRAELDRLGYQAVPAAQRSGQYALHDAGIDLVTRPFRFWDGEEPSRRLRLHFDGGQVADLSDLDRGAPVALARLDPSLIGSIYPRHGEDRVLLRVEDVPALVTDTLLAVEDRHFRSHFGVHPPSLLRATFANLRARRVVQGGSTITQQLVKNFYLDNRRTLQRKFDEALMALILEWRYDKDEILEAYLNEIYLGQDGARAVHGFGLGSQFYFQRPLAELQAHEIALLVAVIRGPSHYDPRRHPERARERRDRILALLGEQQVLDGDSVARARQQPLGIIDGGGEVTRYPAFMGLVQRQLRQHYRPEDLTSAGLRIFTTVDPALQGSVEASLARRLHAIEQQRQMPAAGLQGAVVVTDTDSGEVLALVGGRDARFAGFNRAVDAQRPVGSLLKPFVYLAALESRELDYSPVTLIDDAPISVSLPGNRSWQPRNFDRQWHGPVPLYRGLSESYNAATVRLGMELGVPAVIDVLQRVGLDSRPPAHPSLLLGALAMSPLKVTDLYQTLASGGYRSPPRAIREVTTVSGEPLSRHPLSMAQGVERDSAYMINRLLQESLRHGTGRRVQATLPAAWQLAGKTGTSDGLRDSWFAGFGGNRLAVVWVGRDDNAPAGLTGATGALPVWIDVMASLEPRPLQLRTPPGVQERWVEASTGLGSAEGCADAIRLPFRQHHGPQDPGGCAGVGPVGALAAEPAGAVEADGDEEANAGAEADAERGGLWSRLRGWFGGE